MASIDMQQRPALHNPASPKDTSWDKAAIQNYMDVAALRILEKELDELKKAREARRVSTMTSSSAMQQPVVVPKPTRNRRRSFAGATTSNITTTHPETSFSDCSTESDDISTISPIQEESSGSSTCTDPIDCEPQKEHGDNGVDIRSTTDSIASDRIQVTQEQLTKSDIINQEDPCTPCNSSIQVDSQQQKIDPEHNENQRTREDAMIESRLPEIDDCDTNEDSAKLGSTDKSIMKDSPIKRKDVRPRKQEGPKPLRIDTKFTKMENMRQTDNENPLYSEIRRGLRSTPSPPNPSASKSATLSNTQNTLPESKPSKRVSLSHIQTSWSTNTSANSISGTTKSKPRALSEAFIGVKGLTRKFDTATGLSSPNKTRTFTTAPLSEASLSVSRERKTSLTKGSSALSQLFSPPTPKEQQQQQQPSSPNPRFRDTAAQREPKPLPQITRAKVPIQQQQQQRITVSNNENNTPSSHQWKCSTRRAEHNRIARKAMPPIPKDASSSSSCPSTTLPYPNPLPVYEPQLTRKASPLSRDDDEEEDTSSLETAESKARKRVSFSSIVVDIPPPSPYTDDDDDSPISPKHTSPRLNAGASSSAHILSRWQQQHQRDRLRNAIRNGAHKKSNNTSAHGESRSGHSGTRGFWESFNKEMIDRSSLGETSLTSPTDHTTTTTTRRIVPEPTRSLDDRFVPSSTYKSPVAPLPSTSESLSSSSSASSSSSSSANNTIRRYNNKTWINALQNSVSSRLSFRANTTTQLSSSSSSSSSSSNKPSPPAPWFEKRQGLHTSSSNHHAFDERAATSSPPLNHPTKTRPMKPSSLRKRSNVRPPALARPPAAAQPQWWSRVDHP